MAGMRHYE